MTFSFSWKHSLLGAVLMLILGLGIFLLSSQLPSTNSCVAGSANCNDTTTSFFQGYADVWLRVLAPRCVGGNGPDDCLGPNLLIMISSLLVSGVLLGGLLGGFRGKPRNTIAEQK